MRLPGRPFDSVRHTFRTDLACPPSIHEEVTKGAAMDMMWWQWVLYLVGIPVGTMLVLYVAVGIASMDEPKHDRSNRGGL